MNSFVCPNCNQAISFDNDALEQESVLVCPVCGESFSIFTDEPLK